MLKRKIKWQKVFEDKSELDEQFGGKSTLVFRNTFGEILLTREGENYLAFKNNCPHQNKPLDGCTLQEGHVICPWHKYAFSCETGRGHGLYLEKYELEFRENGVFIGKEGWSLFG